MARATRLGHSPICGPVLCYLGCAAVEVLVTRDTTRAAVMAVYLTPGGHCLVHSPAAAVACISGAGLPHWSA